MMLRLKMLLVWLLRIGHCRGFGVQSPSAYRFIRYVVSEHYPYYAYGALRGVPGVNVLERKLGLFFFRLSNHLQRARWQLALSSPAAPYYIRCIRSGCEAAEVSLKAADGGESLRRVLLTEAGDDRAGVLEDFLARVGTDDLLVVLGIHDDAAGRRQWRRLLADGRTGVAFDLYYCGIIFFDGRHRQHYIVNF